MRPVRLVPLALAALTLSLSGCFVEEPLDAPDGGGPGTEDAGTDPTDGGADPATALPWSDPVVVGVGATGLDGHAAAAGPDGRVVVAWTELWTDPELAFVVRARVFDPAADAWEAPVELGRSPSYAGFVHLAADGAGNVLAAWFAQNDSTHSHIDTVMAARYDADTLTWSAPEVIGSHDSGAGVFGRLTLDAAPSGHAFAAWTYNPSTLSTTEIQASRFDPMAGDWGASAPGSNGEQPVVVSLDGGGALLAYESWEVPNALDVRVFDPASGWTGAETLATPDELYRVRAFADGSGGAAVHLDAFDAGTLSVVSRLKLLGADGAWSDWADSPESVGDALLDAVMVDGRLFVLCADASTVSLSRVDPPATWGAGEAVPASDGGHGYGYARRPDGAEVVSWADYGGARALVRTPGGAWSALAELSTGLPDADGFKPVAVVGADGALTLVWSEIDGSDLTVAASRLEPDFQ